MTARRRQRIAKPRVRVQRNTRTEVIDHVPTRAQRERDALRAALEAELDAIDAALDAQDD